MPKNRLAMNEILELLRLRSLGLSERKIAQMMGCNRSSVTKYLKMANEAGISYFVAKEMLPEEFQLKFYALDEIGSSQRHVPDYKKIGEELKKHPHLTLLQLWREYKDQYPDCVGYSQFANRFKEFKQINAATMHFEHKAAEKMFIDFSGDRVAIYDRKSDDISFRAKIFVAVLGASNYTYTSGFLNEKTQSWIQGSMEAFEYFNGVPVIIVPDNAKAAICSYDRYEPVINPTFLEFARHYLVEVAPARPRKPRDKAKVENHVLIVERSILARLRNQKFYSLDELNSAIAPLLEELNNKDFSAKDGSRKTLFDQVDKPALRKLPVSRYEYAYWKKATVQNNYHVVLDYRWYSVPFKYIGQKVDLRITSKIVEIFSKGIRIASHLVAECKGQYVTEIDHMPENHKNVTNKWDEAYIMARAQKIGSFTQKLCEGILSGRYVREQGYKACQGVIFLARSYSDQELEKACERAVFINSYTYKSVKSILKMNLQSQPLNDIRKDTQLNHDNLRGQEYFSNKIESENN